MNATLEKPKLRRARPQAASQGKSAQAQIESVSTPPAACVISTDVHHQLSTLFYQAGAILELLAHAFDGESMNEPSNAPGLMGTIQHVDGLLTQASNLVYEQPLDSLPETLETESLSAHSLVSLLDSLEASSGYEFRLDDGVYFSYFQSALAATIAAQRALEGVKHA